MEHLYAQKHLQTMLGYDICTILGHYAA